MMTDTGSEPVVDPSPAKSPVESTRAKEPISTSASACRPDVACIFTRNRIEHFFRPHIVYQIQFNTELDTETVQPNL